MKGEYGLRSSMAGTNGPEEGTKDVASLAQPDTKDVKCQTHGPRRHAYYRSIPAKVNTNLPYRSPSTSMERLPDATHVSASGSNSGLLKYATTFSKGKALYGSSPHKSKTGKALVSSSQSPGRRR